MKPTSADIEAYEAIKDQDLRPHKHPRVAKWFTLITKIDSSVRQNWPLDERASSHFSSQNSTSTDVISNQTADLYHKKQQLMADRNSNLLKMKQIYTKLLKIEISENRNS